MKVLLLGADGQVGFELRAALAPFAEVDARTRSELDLADLDALRACVRGAGADAIVNAAAHTDVDGAERDERAATRVNGEAVALLGQECKRASVALVHYSTDFVFDGAVERPYREDDATSPLSAYGRSKLEGERALLDAQAPALILRTAWVYGLRRKSFVSSILRLAREREELSVVADQVGSPTFCRDVALVTALLLHRERRSWFQAIDEARGVYHLAGEGAVSRYDFARAIVELDPKRAEHKVQRLLPIATSAYPLPAKRPAFAPLDTTKLRERFGVSLPPWRESLARALAG